MIFVFENLKNKINYTINEKVFKFTTLSNRFFLLGYPKSKNKYFDK